MRIPREDRTMIQYRKTWQNTARIARIIDNMVICRTFVRSVFFITTTRGDGFIDRRRGYRPRTNAYGIGGLQVFHSLRGLCGRCGRCFTNFSADFGIRRNQWVRRAPMSSRCPPRTSPQRPGQGPRSDDLVSASSHQTVLVKSSEVSG